MAVVILIGGPTCSGKTNLARALECRLGSDRCVTVNQDDFYHDLQHLPEETRARSNFDRPGAVDRRALASAVRSLSLGRAVDVPTYDFTKHCRTPAIRQLAPAPFVLVEGTLVLHWSALRRLASVRVYVDIGPEECLRRRVRRDNLERGRSPESVLTQWHASVWPMHRRYVLPTRRAADVLVSGNDVDDAVVRIVQALNQRGIRC